jgi:hypothetical protein
MEVVNPCGEAAVAVRGLAPRPASLAGRRVGVLDNSKPNADLLLGRLAELLVARTGAGAVARWRKPGASRPAPDLEVVAAGADVVLTGSAD